MKAGWPQKKALKTKAAHELKDLAILTAYLYVAFGAIIFYRYAVLQGVGVSSALWGLAIVKALLVAKFILLGRAAGIGRRFKSKPLIWATLHKSTVFLVLVLFLTIVEEAIVGLIHGRSIVESIGDIGGGTTLQLVATLALVFFILFPYFAVESLEEVLGANTLRRVFFVERRGFRALEHAEDRLSER